MTVQQSTLARAFMEDHRHLTRGFTDLIAALEGDDPVDAGRIADRIDRLAGPHIEFEETSYYPAVRRSIGAENVRQLYREHRIALGAIRALLKRDPANPLTDAERDQLLAASRTALDHAVSCGTLLGYVTALDDAEQDAMLSQLEAARERGRRWTELPDFEH